MRQWGLECVDCSGGVVCRQGFTRPVTVSLTSRSFFGQIALLYSKISLK